MSLFLILSSLSSVEFDVRPSRPRRQDNFLPAAQPPAARAPESERRNYMPLRHGGEATFCEGLSLLRGGEVLRPSNLTRRGVRSGSAGHPCEESRRCSHRRPAAGVTGHKTGASLSSA